MIAQVGFHAYFHSLGHPLKTLIDLNIERIPWKETVGQKIEWKMNETFGSSCKRKIEDQRNGDLNRMNYETLH